jgi:outer membrane receptor for monomeric catechols
MRANILFSAIFLLIIFASNSAAEDASTRLSGKVVDQNNAAVAGAVVSANRVGTSIKSQTMTNVEGEFAIDLTRGEYSLTISANGFENNTRIIDLREAEVQTDVIVLSVQKATASVTVSDDAIYVAGDISSATKTYKPLRDVPQAVTVIKKDQIRDQGLSSIASVVQYVPGVSSHQGENNRDEIIIRGNKSNADFFRDGVRDDVQYYRDLYNLERFEALKGPNAMIFGRGGGGGVINRVTNEAGFSPIREFSATGGSVYGGYWAARQR